jgi:hypothetical protein
MARGHFDWMAGRLGHVYHIAIRPVWGVGVIVMMGIVLTSSQAAISLLVAPDKRDPWDIYNVLPRLGWGWYVAVGSVVVLVLVIEGSYRHHRKTELKLEQALDALASPSPLRLLFDDTQHHFRMQHVPNSPTRLVASVTVENVGGKYLDQCQVRVQYKAEGSPDSQMNEPYGRHIPYPPFALLPDDSKVVHILSRLDPRYSEGVSYLTVISLVQTEDGWKDSGAMSVLMPGQKYEMTIEALSANARRTTIRLGLYFEEDDWIIRNIGPSV